MITMANFVNASRKNLPNQFSISNTAPRWWKGPSIDELSPGDMVWDLKKGKINEIEYTVLYVAMLNRLEKAGYDWSKLEGRTLLCWEPTGRFCHRRILGTFLKSRGFEVEVY